MASIPSRRSVLHALSAGGEQSTKSKARLDIPWLPEACLALSPLSYYTPLMSLTLSLLIASLRPVGRPSKKKKRTVWCVEIIS